MCNTDSILCIVPHAQHFDSRVYVIILNAVDCVVFQAFTVANLVHLMFVVI